MVGELLRNEIVAAFDDNRYPGDDRITVYDSAGREWDETFKLLRGGCWKEMPVRAFMRGDTPIPDLTPEAFYYYMPALLLAALEDSDVAFSLAHYLSPTSARGTEGEFPFECTDAYNRRIAMFSDKQRAVIVRVFREVDALGWVSEDVHLAIERLRRDTDV